MYWLITPNQSLYFPILARTIPFSIRFLSDNYEFTGVDPLLPPDGEAGTPDVGFMLAFVQDGTNC